MKIHSDRSRIRAAFVNSGKFGFPEAERKLASMCLTIHLDESVASTPAGQAAALTAVLTGARCFSTVTITGAINAPLLVDLPVGGACVGDAAKRFGAKTKPSSAPSRLVLIGGSGSGQPGWAVRAIWNGWSGGIAPASQNVTIGRSDCPLAGIAAGALAVGHAFFAEQDDRRAGRTMQGVSLWTPDLGGGVGQAWMDDPGPLYREVFLPEALWLVGLGNLGQAFMWSLTWLPYADPARLMLFLQDDDLVGEENWGTSVLVRRGRYNVLKTRVAEEWAEHCGYKVRRIDRRLDEQMRRTVTEPGIALAGLDRMPARRLLGLPGFDYVIDAGLGADAHDFHRLRVNVFDADRTPSEHFEGVEDKTADRIETIKQLPAYQAHGRKSAEASCGMVELAGISVAAPFVSAVAGALAITQVIRIASNLAPYSSIYGPLDDLRGVRAVRGIASPRATIGSVAANPFGSI